MNDTRQALDDTDKALDSLMQRWLQAWQASKGDLPGCTQDPDWPSPCETGLADADGLVRWQPWLRQDPSPFLHLEKGLEIQIHPDLHTYYGRYWSANLSVIFADRVCTLFQVWNEEDLECLRGNLLGHVFARRRNRVTDNFFIGLGPEDMIIGLDNASGNITLERAGQAPHHRLAASLTEFLQACTPHPVIC